MSAVILALRVVHLASAHQWHGAQTNYVTEHWTGGSNPNPSYTYDPNGNLAYDQQYVYTNIVFHEMGDVI